MATGDLKRMKKAELLKMARAMKLGVRGGMLKAEIIAVIKKGPLGTKKKKPAKSKPKTGRKKAAAPKAGAKKKAAPKRRLLVQEKPAAREHRLEAKTIRQKAEAGKYYLGAEEAAMPPVESLDIPGGYGIDRIVTMVRDPHWLFSYWEVTIGRLEGLEKKLGDNWQKCTMILRVFDLTDDSTGHFDISLAPDSRNWYINASPNRRYQIAVGILTPDGKFIEIARSNTVDTPREGVSEVVDDRWMIPEELFDLIFAASGGHDIHVASAELRELLERRLIEEIGSGAVSSFGSGQIRELEKQRGFRLWIATELILYGATEPDARLTVQGKKVKLRSDGTFSMRFALPDGAIDLPVTSVSADSAEERTIETKVNRKSKRKDPVVR